MKVEVLRIRNGIRDLGSGAPGQAVRVRAQDLEKELPRGVPPPVVQPPKSEFLFLPSLPQSQSPETAPETVLLIEILCRVGVLMLCFELIWFLRHREPHATRP